MQENVRTITTKDLLEMTVEKLENITGIPVSMANDVSRPIWEAIQDIRAVIKALRDAEPTEEEAQETEDGKDGGDDGKGDGV